MLTELSNVRLFYSGPDFSNFFFLTASALDNDSRRALILISKSLQNLANGIQFGAKESYMNVCSVLILYSESLLTVFAGYE